MMKINPVVPQFSSHPLLHTELRAKADAYFKQHQLSPQGGAAMLRKAVLLILIHLTIYGWIISGYATGWAGLLACLLLGISTATIGFNIMHDGQHNAFSKYRWLNSAAGMTLGMLGADPFVWRFKHLSLHHPFTNIHGADGDIEVHPMMRICQTQSWKPWHRYQHYYVWVLYALYYFIWIFILDFYRYFTGLSSGFRLPRRRLADHIQFWVFKLISFGMLIGAPVVIYGTGIGLAGFLIYGMITSLLITTIFQMAHAVEAIAFPQMDQEGKLAEEWAVHQLQTTANFATGSRLWCWLTGGLNLQIEHHLFPGISHEHYPALAPMVKAVCAQHGITYHEHPGFLPALVSHWRYVKAMGEG